MFANITNVHNFIISYPHDVPTAGGFRALDVLNYVDFDTVMGNVLENDALVPAGMEQIGKTKKVATGRAFEYWRVNFAVIMRRETGIDEFRRATAEFMTEFTNWANGENRRRDTPNENPILPKFGNTKNENMSVGGGYRTKMIESQGVHFGEFTIFLGFNFELMSYMGVLL